LFTVRGVNGVMSTPPPKPTLALKLRRKRRIAVLALRLLRVLPNAVPGKDPRPQADDAVPFQVNTPDNSGPGMMSDEGIMPATPN
jgi:hypothetical protein